VVVLRASRASRPLRPLSRSHGYAKAGRGAQPIPRRFSRSRIKTWPHRISYRRIVVACTGTMPRYRGTAWRLGGRAGRPQNPDAVGLYTASGVRRATGQGRKRAAHRAPPVGHQALAMSVGETGGRMARRDLCVIARTGLHASPTGLVTSPPGVYRRRHRPSRCGRGAPVQPTPPPGFGPPHR